MRIEETTWALRALQASYVEVMLSIADVAEMAPGGLSASSGTLLSPSSSSSRLCTLRARASGKTAHFYTLVKSIGIGLQRVEDLHYLIHSGSSSWKCANSLDVTGFTIRWTSKIQYFRPSPYETNADGFLLNSRVEDASQGPGKAPGIVSTAQIIGLEIRQEHGELMLQFLP